MMISKVLVGILGLAVSSCGGVVFDGVAFADSTANPCLTIDTLAAGKPPTPAGTCSTHHLSGFFVDSASGDYSAGFDAGLENGVSLPAVCTGPLEMVPRETRVGPGASAVPRLTTAEYPTYRPDVCGGRASSSVYLDVLSPAPTTVGKGLTIVRTTSTINTNNTTMMCRESRAVAVLSDAPAGGAAPQEGTALPRFDPSACVRPCLSGGTACSSMMLCSVPVKDRGSMFSKGLWFALAQASPPYEILDINLLAAGRSAPAKEKVHKIVVTLHDGCLDETATGTSVSGAVHVFGDPKAGDFRLHVSDLFIPVTLPNGAIRSARFAQVPIPVPN